MATKNSSPKNKLEKKELLENQISGLNRRIWNVQDEMIQLGKNIVSDWLLDADSEGIFEEAADWLIGPDGDAMLESQSGTMAYDAVKYAIYQFDNHCNDSCADEEESDDVDENDPSSFYYNVREYFNV